MLYKIYALIDPRDQSVHYVGQTRVHPIERTIAHIREAINGKTCLPKSEWIASLLEEGVLPGYLVIEECTEENRFEREGFWIEEYIRRGEKLYNTILIPTKPGKKPKRERQERIFIYPDEPPKKVERWNHIMFDKRTFSEILKTSVGKRENSEYYIYDTTMGSMTSVSYKWLEENDPGWTPDEIPSARTLVRQIPILLTISSVQRSRIYYKNREK